MLNVERPSLRNRIVRLAQFAAAAMIALLVSGGAARAATLTVTTTEDELTPNDGSVSLREAITVMNARSNLGDPDIIAQNPGTFGLNDTIRFNIPGTGLRVIHVGSSASAPGIPLQQILRPLVINGYTQPGSHVNTRSIGDNALLLIELNGASAGAAANGLDLAGGATTVRGLVINHFSANGILIESGGNTIAGNFIGTDSRGTNPGPGNANDGIQITKGPNTIGGEDPASSNIISFNKVNGIEVIVPTILIDGNLIGNNSHKDVQVTGSIVVEQ